MAIMMSSATCRSTCSAAGACCWPGSGAPTSPAAMARSRRWHASSPGIRRKWRSVRIILRGDSGFANDPLDAVVRGEPRGFVFGLHTIHAWKQRSATKLPRRSDCVWRRAGPPGCSVTSGIARSTVEDRERRVVGKAGARRTAPDPGFSSPRSTPFFADPLAPSTRFCTCTAGEAEDPHRRTVRTVRRSSTCRHHGRERAAGRLVLGHRLCARQRVPWSRLRLPSSPTPGPGPLRSRSSTWLSQLRADLQDASTSRSPRACRRGQLELTSSMPACVPLAGPRRRARCTHSIHQPLTGYVGARTRIRQERPRLAAGARGVRPEGLSPVRHQPQDPPPSTPARRTNPAKVSRSSKSGSRSSPRAAFWRSP